MTRAVATVPHDTDVLCEHCGYVLNGLPDDGRCPECGQSISDSVDEQIRRPPRWEWEDRKPGLADFLATSAQVLFRPTNFYRTLATRRTTAPARRFAYVHWLLVAAMMTAAIWMHLQWNLLPGGTRLSRIVLLPLLVAIFFLVAGTTHLAARLTHWEATYRGIRLPLAVVKRGLYYHAVHYVPVAAMIVATVFIFGNFVDVRWTVQYLYTLCGEVIVGAMYLFNTYWIGMRNMMYANR